jgi:hypothetical protein
MTPRAIIFLLDADNAPLGRASQKSVQFSQEITK